jgi:hypothetical protein
MLPLPAKGEITIQQVLLRFRAEEHTQHSNLKTSICAYSCSFIAIIMIIIIFWFLA